VPWYLDGDFPGANERSDHENQSKTNKPTRLRKPGDGSSAQVEQPQHVWRVQIVQKVQETRRAQKARARARTRSLARLPTPGADDAAGGDDEDADEVSRANAASAQAAWRYAVSQVKLQEHTTGTQQQQQPAAAADGPLSARLWAGWLWKKGQGMSTFGRTNWKRRWFVLTTQCLSYYESIGDATRAPDASAQGAAKGSITIRDYTLDPADVDMGRLLCVLRSPRRELHIMQLDPSTEAGGGAATGAVPKQDRQSFGIFLEVLRGLLADTPKPQASSSGGGGGGGGWIHVSSITPPSRHPRPGGGGGGGTARGGINSGGASAIRELIRSESQLRERACRQAERSHARAQQLDDELLSLGELHGHLASGSHSEPA
jgi:hypothetical protein